MMSADCGAMVNKTQYRRPGCQKHMRIISDPNPSHKVNLAMDALVDLLNPFESDGSKFVHSVDKKLRIAFMDDLRFVP